MYPAGKTITILRGAPGGFDAYGDPVASTVARIDVPGCAIVPRYSSEPTERGRNGVIIGLSAYVPASAGITHTDRVEIDGVAYLVEGEPALWSSPFTGWTPGVEVALKRAVG